MGECTTASSGGTASQTAATAVSIGAATAAAATNYYNGWLPVATTAAASSTSPLERADSAAAADAATAVASVSGAVIECVDANKLSPQQMYEQYIAQRRPVLLRHGCAAVFSTKNEAFRDDSAAEDKCSSNNVDDATGKNGDNLVQCKRLLALIRETSPQAQVLVEQRGSDGRFGHGNAIEMTLGEFQTRLKCDGATAAATAAAATTTPLHGGGGVGVADLYLASQPQAPPTSPGAAPQIVSAPLDALVRNGYLPLRPRLVPTLVPSQLNVWMGGGGRRNWDDESSVSHLGHTYSHGQRQPAEKEEHGSKRAVPGSNPGAVRGRGSSSGLHHDYEDNLYLLLAGKKRFRLFAPSDSHRLYPRGPLLLVHKNGRINYVGSETAADGRVEPHHRNVINGWSPEKTILTTSVDYGGGGGGDGGSDGRGGEDIAATATGVGGRGGGIGDGGGCTTLEVRMQRAYDRFCALTSVDDLQVVMQVCVDRGLAAPPREEEAPDEYSMDISNFTIVELAIFESVIDAVLHGLSADQAAHTADMAAGAAVAAAAAAAADTAGTAEACLIQKDLQLMSSFLPAAGIQSTTGDKFTTAMTRPNHSAMPNELASSSPRADPSFPLYAEATEISVDLQPGDALYLPCGWWHEVTTWVGGDESDAKEHTELGKEAAVCGSSSGGHLHDSATAAASTHMSQISAAVNYWFHPPDCTHAGDMMNPYTCSFFEEAFARTASDSGLLR